MGTVLQTSFIRASASAFLNITANFGVLFEKLYKYGRIYDEKTRNYF
jgi:hypothetical protein